MAHSNGVPSEKGEEEHELLPREGYIGAPAYSRMSFYQAVIQQLIESKPKSKATAVRLFTRVQKELMKKQKVENSEMFAYKVPDSQQDDISNEIIQAAAEAIKGEIIVTPFQADNEPEHFEPKENRLRQPVILRRYSRNEFYIEPSNNQDHVELVKSSITTRQQSQMTESEESLTSQGLNATLQSRPTVNTSSGDVSTITPTSSPPPESIKSSTKTGQRSQMVESEESSASKGSNATTQSHPAVTMSSESVCTITPASSPPPESIKSPTKTGQQSQMAESEESRASSGSNTTTQSHPAVNTSSGNVSTSTPVSLPPSEVSNQGILSKTENTIKNSDNRKRDTDGKGANDKTDIWEQNEFETQEKPYKKKTESVVIKFATKLTKYFTPLIFGGAVVIGGLVVKSTLLILANAYTQDYTTSTCPSVDVDGERRPYYERYMVMLIIMTCLCFPDLLAFLYSLWRIIKKTKEVLFPIAKNEPNGIKTMVTEILDAIGQTFLMLLVVPAIDATLAVVIFAFVSFIPLVIKIWKNKKVSSAVNPQSVGSGESMPSKDSQESNRTGTNNTCNPGHHNKKLAIPVVALVLQLIGICLISWQVSVETESAGLVIAFIISLIFISTRHWENFWTDEKKAWKRKVTKVERKIEIETYVNFRYEITAFCSTLRMATIVAFSFLIHFVIEGNQNIVAYNSDSNEEGIRFDEALPNTTNCSSMITAFWNTGLTNMFVSLALFYSGVIACQTKIQRFGFAPPLVEVTLIMSSLTAAYTIDGKPSMTLMEYFSIQTRSPSVNQFIGWRTNELYDVGSITGVVCVGLFLGTLPFVALATHIWKENDTPMMRIEDLFMKPIFAGSTICEDMMMNRFRCNSENSNGGSTSGDESPSHIVLCITIWQENEKEMKQILTSIMRLDKYQAGKRQEPKFSFEVQVCFDSAIQEKKCGEKNLLIVNKYVERFMRLLPVTADIVSSGSGNNISSVRMETPYGGRIEVTLPMSKSLMLIHLKDANKIRKKKRWSQCMYLNYILRCLPKIRRDKVKLDNPYLLALDGDVDFQPEALIDLLSTMRKDENVGAACGRIHPIGSGPVVWFQKFEYAVGHWLQKSAEDILGCVLCSPGCFSLFRASALKKVARKYMTKATEAQHMIQRDQGEDRWLCTLLLKQGYRIEYCAASDSYTSAPEHFAEFYKQRRRWAPSTMANIMDILLDAKAVVEKNEDITWGFIIYQMGLMASSILGPSTVVLIVQGALQYVFGLSPAWSLVVALTPVAYFTVICYTTKPEFQVTVAKILTILYALLMMAVLVGVIGQMAQSLLNPTSLFMIFMISLYSFTGLIHPTEWTCLIHGMLYYICVPSAFIFLPIYSYCNMNEVSWGTREEKPAKQDKDGKKETAEKDNEEETNQTQSNSFGVDSIFPCNLCVKPKNSENKENEKKSEKVIEEKEQSNEQKETNQTQSNNFGLNNIFPCNLCIKPKNSEEKKNERKSDREIEEEKSNEQDFREFCFDVPTGGSSVKTDRISDDEETFWKHLISKHLKPENPEEEKLSESKIKPKLKELKNKMSGAYLFINCLWLVLTFSIALIVSDVNITLTDKNGVAHVLNPLSFIFLIFFLVILAIQFTTMLFHRWYTFLHCMANVRFLPMTKSGSTVNGSTKAKTETSVNSSPPVNQTPTFIMQDETVPKVHG